MRDRVMRAQGQMMGHLLSPHLVVCNQKYPDYRLQMKGNKKTFKNYLFDRRQQSGGGCIINSFKWPCVNSRTTNTFYSEMNDPLSSPVVCQPMMYQSIQYLQSARPSHRLRLN